jgi:hypothetical protein
MMDAISRSCSSITTWSSVSDAISQSWSNICSSHPSRMPLVEANHHLSQSST